MKIALWGAGEIGKRAIEEIGRDKIKYVIDNDSNKIGKSISGIKIISFKEFLEQREIKRILIASYYVDDIYNQILEHEGISVDVYRPLFDGYGIKDKFIENGYIEETKKNEAIWNNNLEHKIERHYINGLVNVLNNSNVFPMFDHVEIETINRCNGKCSFCPVSVGNDIRKKTIMSEALFHKIINELSDINYSGKLCLFSNNEPFIDSRIIQFQQEAREKLPNARLHLFTNGTLISVEKMLEILPYLDELIIDNYNQELVLNNNIKEIYNYCLNHEELINKITIVLRKQDEILTSRGGNAPNRNIIKNISSDSCLMPFFQLIIRPDGKVSLCCNDAYGEMTMGDVSKESILEVWNGEMHKDIIQRIVKGRNNIKLCSNCDTYNLATRMKRI